MEVYINFSFTFDDKNSNIKLLLHKKICKLLKIDVLDVEKHFMCTLYCNALLFEEVKIEVLAKGHQLPSKLFIY